MWLPHSRQRRVALPFGFMARLSVASLVWPHLILRNMHIMASIIIG
jgi:hypothetical protein